MKIIDGVDQYFRPVCYLVPENIAYPKKRTFMMERATARGEICGLPIGLVRNADGHLTGDVGVELPLDLDMDVIWALGSTLDHYASQMSDYAN